MGSLDLVEELNRRFDYGGNGDTVVTVGHVFQKIENDQAIDAAVRSNTPENARLTFDRHAEDYLEDLANENFRLFKRVADDPMFANALLEMLFDRLRSSSNVVEELIAQGEGTKVSSNRLCATT